MKKLALVLAIALIAAFSAPAFAGEFTLNGSYRLSAVRTDTGLTDTDADNLSYFAQRFRLPFAWKVNDNVQAFMRTDWAERNTNSTNAGTWGTEGMYNSTNLNNMQIDYAWVKITQPMFDVTVGRQEVMLGNWSLLDIDQEGITMNIKLAPVTITLAYGKLNEGNTGTAITQGNAGVAGSTNSRDDGVYSDADSYSAQVMYNGGNWQLGAMFSEAIDRDASFDDKKIGYGVFFNGTWGAWGLKSELDIFDGEASTTVDYEGMNLWADLSYKASDTLTVGLAGYYANGNNSATKTQLSSVSSSGYSFQIFDYDFNSAMMIDHFPQLSGDNFDMATDAGIQAVKGYLRWKAMPDVTVFGSLAYATPEENIDLNSKTYFVASVDYAWIPNVTLSVGGAYIIPDYTNPLTIDSSATQLVARLGVSF